MLFISLYSEQKCVQGHEESYSWINSIMGLQLGEKVTLSPWLKYFHFDHKQTKKSVNPGKHLFALKQTNDDDIITYKVHRVKDEKFTAPPPDPGPYNLHEPLVFGLTFSVRYIWTLDIYARSNSCFEIQTQDNVY